MSYIILAVDLEPLAGVSVNFSLFQTPYLSIHLIAPKHQTPLEELEEDPFVP